MEKRTIWGHLVKIDEVFSKINGSNNLFFRHAFSLSYQVGRRRNEKVLTRNHSSVVVNIELRESAAGRTSKNFLTGGDAEVAIWERLWERHHNAPSVLAYDLMQTPHHCSWHTLSTTARPKSVKRVKCRNLLDQPCRKSENSAKLFPVAVPSRMTTAILRATVQNGNTTNCRQHRPEVLLPGNYPTTESPAPLEFCVAQDEMEELGQKIRSGAPRILTSGIVDAIGARAAETAAVKKEGNRRYA